MVVSGCVHVYVHRLGRCLVAALDAPSCLYVSRAELHYVRWLHGGAAQGLWGSFPL